MGKIYTAQYRYNGNDRLDVTVKGNHPVGKFFAPTWDMVMAVKRGHITVADYDSLYQNILANSIIQNGDVWDRIALLPSVTFVCFCPANSHCHRYALADAFASLGYGTYEGERTVW